MVSRPFEALLQAVAKHLALESLEDLGEGVYAIPLDDQPAMLLRESVLGGELEVICPLGVQIPRERRDLALEVLQGNLLQKHTAGGVLGTRGAEQQLVYWKRLPLDQPPAAAIAQLEEVAVMARLWEAKVGQELEEGVH